MPLHSARCWPGFGCGPPRRLTAHQLIAAMQQEQHERAAQALTCLQCKLLAAHLQFEQNFELRTYYNSAFSVFCQSEICLRLDEDSLAARGFVKVQSLAEDESNALLFTSRG